MRWLAPWSASSGTHSSASPMPAPSKTTARAESMTPCLFSDDVLKGGPGKYGEDGVVETEESQVPSGVLDHRGADPADHDRDREREQEERQEHLPGASGHGHRREERPHRAQADVGEKDRRHGGGVDRREEDREQGHRDRLDDHEEREGGEDLPQPDRAPVAGSEDEGVEDALLALGDECARQP